MSLEAISEYDFALHLFFFYYLNRYWLLIPIGMDYFIKYMYLVWGTLKCPISALNFLISVIVSFQILNRIHEVSSFILSFSLSFNKNALIPTM